MKNGKMIWLVFKLVITNDLCYYERKELRPELINLWGQIRLPFLCFEVCLDIKCSLSLLFNITRPDLPPSLGEHVLCPSVNSCAGEESVKKPSLP